MWKYLGCEIQEMFLQDKILRNQAGHLEMKQALMFHRTACSPPLTDFFSIKAEPQRHNAHLRWQRGILCS